MKSFHNKYYIIVAVTIILLFGLLLLSGSQRPSEPHLLFSLKGGPLQSPVNVIQDQASGKIFVSDAGTGSIHIFNQKGQYLTSFGLPGFGNGHFTYPYGLLITSHGTLWISDPPNHVIQEFTLEGKFLKRVFYGSDGTEPGLLASYKNQVYVADVGRKQIVLLDGTGKEINSCFNQVTIGHPQGLAVDSKGYLWVADQGSSVIEIFQADGKLSRKVNINKGQRTLIGGIAIDGFNRVWVSLPISKQTQILDNAGNVLYSLISQVTLPSNLWAGKRNQTFLIDRAQALIEVWSGVK